MTLALLSNLDFAGGGAASEPEVYACYASWQSAVVFSGWLLWVAVTR
jgi:hypothetical protein